MEGTARHSDRRRSSLVTDIVNADKSIINQQRRQSITERKQSLASDVHITSPEQAAINARRMSYTPTNHEVRWSWTVIRSQTRRLELRWSQSPTRSYQVNISRKDSVGDWDWPLPCPPSQSLLFCTQFAVTSKDHIKIFDLKLNRGLGLGLWLGSGFGFGIDGFLGVARSFFKWTDCTQNKHAF